MCTYVHMSVTKWCTVGYGTGALWDLSNGSISSHSLRFMRTAFCTTMTSHEPRDVSDHRLLVHFVQALKKKYITAFHYSTSVRKISWSPSHSPPRRPVMPSWIYVSMDKVGENTHCPIIRCECSPDNKQPIIAQRVDIYPNLFFCNDRIVLIGFRDCLDFSTVHSNYLNRSVRCNARPEQIGNWH